MWRLWNGLYRQNDETIDNCLIKIREDREHKHVVMQEFYGTTW